MINPRHTTYKDKRIGKNILKARKAAKVTRITVAGFLGITYQQVEKYENGSNRIPASRLAEVAQFLGLPITGFYEGVL